MTQDRTSLKRFLHWRPGALAGHGGRLLGWMLLILPSLRPARLPRRFVEAPIRRNAALIQPGSAARTTGATSHCPLHTIPAENRHPYRH